MIQKILIIVWSLIFLSSSLVAADEINQIEKCLSGLRLADDAAQYEKADELLKQGIPLPKSHRDDFKTTEDRFRHLSRDYHDLYIALRKNPELLKEIDEQKRSILHWASNLGAFMGSNSASLILDLLFKDKNADFSLQDINGDTPVHMAAICSNQRTNRQCIFPSFVRAAAKRNFDFSTLNTDGKAVLHLAILTIHQGDTSLVALLSVHPSPPIDLNQLTLSGSTAFYYAINHLQVEDALRLLHLGASKTKYGQADRDPMAEIAGLINQLLQDINDGVYKSEEQERARGVILKLEEIRDFSLAKPEENEEEKGN